MAKSYDVIIKNGMIVDGARNPRYRADVGIKGTHVKTIGRLHESDAKKVIDATGHIVAPGYIDLHCHYDAQAFWDPYCSLSGWHGITTVAIGKCGFGFAPVRPEERDRAMRTMERVEAIPYDAMKRGLPWDWVTYPDFLDSLDRKPLSVNLLPHVPVNPLLIWVLGLERAKAGDMPTDAEHAELKRLLDEAMEAGANGWSAQRLSTEGNPQRDFDGTHMASDRMHDETAIALAEVLRDRNDGTIQMTHGSDDHEADLRHEIELAEISGRPFEYQVLVPRSGKHRQQIAWLQDCMQKGLRIYGQAATSDAGITWTFEDFSGLWDDSPAWREVTMGNPEERLLKMADMSKRDFLKAHPPNEGLSGGMQNVILKRIMSPEYKKYEGMTVEMAGREMGVHMVDALCEIAIADRLQTVFTAPLFGAPTRYAKELADFEYAIPGLSDGGAHTKYLTTGRFPTEFITNYARDTEWITLEQAHWQLSGYAAFACGIKDRGVIREDAPADIVVYDLEKLALVEPEIAHDLPGGDWRRVQRCTGYRAIVVNGGVTMEDDKETGVPSGQVLRHGRGKRSSR